MAKHLTAEERGRIESWLREGRSLSTIARSLGKSVSTISREVKSRSTPSNKSAVGRIPNRCIQRRECFKSYLCDNPKCNRERCSTCKLCNSVCPDFREEHCSKLEKPPYVCNGCKTEHKCTLRKRYYLHRQAQEGYEEVLVSSREGVNITELEIERLDPFFSPLIEKGQSIHHIFVNNPNEFTFCEKTMYKYVDLGLFSVSNIDLLRKCRFKPRKNKSVERKIDKKCRVNRTYQDYLNYLEANPDTAVVQMDTVEGKIGSSVLLTITFTNSLFMLAFIRRRNTAQSIIDIFNKLYLILGHENFIKLFPICLADNGSEFSNPLALEFIDGEVQRTKIFYCDPRTPEQRGRGEKNHEFIRRFSPKGKCMDHLTQDNISEMTDNINSYSRESLGDKPPYEVFRFIYGQDILDKLGAVLIPPNEIILNSSIFKK